MRVNRLLKLRQKRPDTVISQPMALLTWVLISRAQEMWATELRPLIKHAIEPLMAIKRDTSANNVTPVANLSSRQKGDGRGVGVPR